MSGEESGTQQKKTGREAAGEQGVSTEASRGRPLGQAGQHKDIGRRQRGGVRENLQWFLM